MSTVNQPAIERGNLGRSRRTLLPLIDSNSDRTYQLATEVMGHSYDASTLISSRDAAKIGIASALEERRRPHHRSNRTMQNAERIPGDFPKVASSTEAEYGKPRARDCVARRCSGRTLPSSAGADGATLDTRWAKRRGAGDGLCAA